MVAYHDDEWGVPVHDDRRWFEKLMLDGAQAGLSWMTVLRKREGYRQVSRLRRGGGRPLRQADVARLMKDPGIVRNRLKISPRSATRGRCSRSRPNTALRRLDLAIHRRPADRGPPPRPRDMPAPTPLSDALSRSSGSGASPSSARRSCYAFMQATGLVNDHVVDCGQWRAVGGRARARATRGENPRRAAS